MTTATMTREPNVAKSKRDDEPAKIDREVMRIARSVASLRGITIAEYLSERLRPLVIEDHDEETRKLHEQQSARPSRKPKA